MVEEALEDPVTVGMLKIRGDEIISFLNITPGPKIGYILHSLFEEVLDKPEKNTNEYLLKRAGELNELSLEELKKMGESGKASKENEQKKKVEKIRSKYHVE
jgi:hypothetical protein